jgi:hypothetical protein
VARKRPEPHIYDDLDVTSSRLTRFALADREEQVAVLAKLRARSVDDSTTITMGFSSLVIAVFLVIAAPLLTLDIDPVLRRSWVAALVLTLLIMFLLLILTAPALVVTAREQARRERATVWLAAYEDELARRHRLRGPFARRWQREH